MTWSSLSARRSSGYHEFAGGDYLPAGVEFWGVTSGRMKRLGHRSGHFLIGDPADALKRLAASVPDAGRPPRPAQPPVPPADTAGPVFTAEAIMDAVNAAKTGH
jgi:benzoylformate decarboxylase